MRFIFHDGLLLKKDVESDLMSVTQKLPSELILPRSLENNLKEFLNIFFSIFYY